MIDKHTAQRSEFPIEESRYIVNGRMLNAPRVSLLAQEDGVLLTVDDDRNAEFWLQLLLSNERMVSFLEMVAVQRDSNRVKLLDLLAQVRAELLK